MWTRLQASAGLLFDLLYLYEAFASYRGLNRVLQVGAGTMNPATFLRVNGPEPWNVCYPEPSVRPDDSRYGNNPNRVQRHTQFQVIMKPDPGNPQELYLGSLEALGIDTQAHDIRFVEDNWVWRAHVTQPASQKRNHSFYSRHTKLIYAYTL